MIKSRLSFRLDFSLLPALAAMLAWPFHLYMPESWGYENHWIENVQMLVLLLCFILCWRAKTDRAFWRTLAFLFVILALREVNCGRTLFFAVEGKENAYLKWSQIPYGWVVRLAYKAFIIAVVFVFVRVGGLRTCVRLLKGSKWPVWNVAAGAVAVPVTVLSEHYFGYATLEELAELVVYFAMASTIRLYGMGRLSKVQA